MEETENCLLIDYFSFTTLFLSKEDVVELLGLNKPQVVWEVAKGNHGYRQAIYFSSIKVYWDGEVNQGVWCEMTGQGCRAYESFGANDFLGLFKLVRDGRIKITRLDVAFDDHTGLVDISDLCNDTLSGDFISRFRSWEVVQSNKGKSVNQGSVQSSVLIRIYDKAAERGFTDGRHWVRFEIQMRDERAEEFINQCDEPGQIFAGVLLNYLRYVEPTEGDSNKWRWPLKDYWAALIGDALKISIYKTPGVEYNIGNLKTFVVNQAGNAIDTYINIFGLASFLDDLKSRETMQNPKYQQLIQKYGRYYHER